MLSLLSVLLQLGVTSVGAYDLTFSVGLHPAGGVDSVSKQTVARHLQTHHGRTARPCVDPDPQLETLARHVADLEGLDGLQ